MARARIWWFPAAVVGLAAAVVGGVWLAGTRGADAGVSAITLQVDCDVATAGVQTACDLPAGTSQVDVDVFLTSNLADFQLAAFNFGLRSDQSAFFAPDVPPCAGAGLDCNPDMLIPGDAWACGPPVPAPDMDPSPSSALSYIGCFNATIDTYPVMTGVPVTLARVRFDASGNAFSTLGLENVIVFDELGNEWGACNPGVGAECLGAEVQVGADTPTPTVTPTQTPTPTNTPAPAMTPSSTPEGAVSEVLGIHETLCVTGSIAFHGVQGNVALFNCVGLGNQQAFQNLVGCIIDDPGCPNEPLSLLHPEAADFAQIDRDANQIHAGQFMSVIAFVDGDYPVLFETDRGEFLSNFSNRIGASALCYAVDPNLSPVFDPDCDANLSTIGDGVVVVRMAIDPDDERGPGRVTVTQNGASQHLDFTIVGVPETITFTSLDGFESIGTAAHPPTPDGAVPSPHACDQVLDAPASGSTSIAKSHVLVQALDDQGVSVVGSFLAVQDVATGEPVFFPDPSFPRGGLAQAFIPTWDYGSTGIGAIAVLCGGTEPGELNLEARFYADQVNFDLFADYDLRVPFSIPVVAADTDEDGFLNQLLSTHSAPANADLLFDNCMFAVNPAQANTDGNFVSNGPFHPMDDLTAPDSDADGDACDRDDDNDGLDDDEELTGEQCGDIITDPLKMDTDDDGVPDGSECRAFPAPTDPTNPASKPTIIDCGGYTDGDGDGVSRYLEHCYYGTSDNNVDTDEDAGLDGATDGCEIASLNEDRIVDSGDQLLLAMEYVRVLAGGTPLPNFDLTKDGRINSADQLLMARVMVSSVPCTDDGGD